MQVNNKAAWCDCRYQRADTDCAGTIMVMVQTYLSCQPSGPLPVCSDVNREEEVRRVTHGDIHSMSTPDLTHAHNVSNTQH